MNNPRPNRDLGSEKQLALRVIPVQNHNHRLSDEFARLAALSGGDSITLRQLVDAMSARGHALITLFFSIPFLFPIPLPGLSVIFGASIALGGFRYALGRSVWVPHSWLTKRLPGKTLSRIFNAARGVMKRLEKVIRPRGTLLHKSWFRMVVGAVLGLCGLLLAAPLPPGTNFPPALAVVLLSVGSLEEDLLFITLGFIAFTINILLFAALVFYGWEGLMSLF